jgi:predicted DsbA family dithiol-disulfide isomerase
VRQPEWAGPARSDSVWVAYAGNLGLDEEEFSTCLKAEETNAVVEVDLRESLSGGATGTPTIVLNGRSISGFESYQDLRREIISEIERAEVGGN